MTQLKERKDSEARLLARAHYRVDPSTVHIYRLVSLNEEQPQEPIKLLEVCEGTVASGILPVSFGAHPPSGIHFPSKIVQVTPDEYQQILTGALSLPNDWTIEAELPKPELTGQL